MFSTSQKNTGQDLQQKAYLYQKISEGERRGEGQYTVFLLEDNIDDREQILKTLKESPYIYDAHCFDSGERLVGYFVDEGYYDDGMDSDERMLIMVDIHLPGANGMEVLRDLKAHPMTQNIPIIMTTGDSSGKHAEEAHQLQVTGYLLKPLHLSNIHDIIYKCGGRPVA